MALEELRWGDGRSRLVAAVILVERYDATQEYRIVRAREMTIGSTKAFNSKDQELPEDPFVLFGDWYGEAVECREIKYAHAVCLSTVDTRGWPEGRTVLLKRWDRSLGFVFFTDAESPKARSLARTPRAALTFYWGPLDRQVRIRGVVERAGDEVSDECFEMRPRGSQITAWASRQSEELASRNELEERYGRLAAELADRHPLPRPERWRAYRVEPFEVEFWQARSHRLHDRLLYAREASGWRCAWLEP